MQKLWESYCLPFLVDIFLAFRQFPRKIMFIKYASETEQGRGDESLDCQMQADESQCADRQPLKMPVLDTASQVLPRTNESKS